MKPILLIEDIVSTGLNSNSIVKISIMFNLIL